MPAHITTGGMVIPRRECHEFVHLCQKVYFLQEQIAVLEKKNLWQKIRKIYSQKLPNAL